NHHDGERGRSYEEYERQIRVASRDRRQLIQSKPSGNELNSQEAIEKIGDLLKKMKGCLKNIGHKGSTVAAEEVDSAIEAFNKYKLIWPLADKMSPLEKRMSAIEEVVKKGFEQTVRPATMTNGPFKSSNNTYTSIVAPPATKAVVRIRVPGASELQPSKLLSIAQQKIKGAYAIWQMRSNDT
ncbi:putative air1 domain-containing protein, partial [Erysiphe neolycopersici]